MWIRAAELRQTNGGLIAEQRGPVIRLQDGPGAGWQFYEEDFLERMRAAQRMGRTVPDASGWALGYERPISGAVWTWRGVNCHPAPTG